MPKQRINPPELFPSLQYGFSQLVLSQGGRTVYVSGQVAWDAHEKIVGPGDLRAQTWQGLRNLQTALQAAGGALSDVVSLRIYIAHGELADTRAISEGLKEFFPPESAPTSTWIGVPGLADPDFLIEIEAVAVIEEAGL
jgi:enamine deaminase RidA (YjgF/YER057c/UK114 family)